MLDKGQSQRFFGDGLFQHQFFEQEGDGCGADHLVFDHVAQLTFVDVKGYPAHDVVQSGGGQNVGDTVAHAEVGAHSAVEDMVFGKHGKDVCSGAADVHAQHFDVFFAGDGLHDISHGCGSGHDGHVFMVWAACPFHQFVVAGRLFHHVFHKEVVDLVTCRAQVFRLQFGADIFGDDQVNFVLESFLDLILCLHVSGVDHGQFVACTEAGFGIGTANEFGHFHHVFHRAAVFATGHEDHVRAQVTDTLDLLVVHALVVAGDQVHHDGACAKGCTFCTLTGHGSHHTGHHHLQSATG